MRKKIMTFLLLFAMVMQFGSAVMGEETEITTLSESELYAKSAVLMDADSGRILYEKDGNKAMANASTTKILTCIMALEYCDLDQVVVASSLAASQPKVHLGMRTGQKFYLKDLLYGLMLESYNDCAVAIAEHIAGGTESFAKMMNHKAKEIGCKDSYFITPNGLDAKNAEGFHHTTASDLALIMRYCIRLSEKSKDFLEITGTGQYTFTDADGNGSYHCYNHNAFLQMMEGALSGKTGFTGNAGYCYVGSLERDGRTYIVALLACGWPNNKSYKWSDAKKLMKYGIDNYEKRNLKEIAIDRSQLQPILVVNGQGARIGDATRVNLVVKEERVPEDLLVRKDENITVAYEIADVLYAPVHKSEYVGKITYYLGDKVIKEDSVFTAEEIKRIDYIWCVQKTMRLLWL